MRPASQRPAIILASASPRRRELLREMGIVFTVVPSGADEIHTEAMTASEQCLINAGRKARDVARRHPGALVIGADTLVTLENRHFGKPQNLKQAAAMLGALSGRTHQVVTGVCLHQESARRETCFTVLTEVTFQSLSRARIDEYFNRVNPLDKAGAYALQEQGDLIIRQVEGSRSNVVGLPIERLTEELKAWNLSA